MQPLATDAVTLLAHMEEPPFVSTASPGHPTSSTCQQPASSSHTRPSEATGKTLRTPLLEAQSSNQQIQSSTALLGDLKLISGPVIPNQPALTCLYNLTR